MFLEITGKRFDELTLIILSKRVTVNTQTSKKAQREVWRWQKLYFIAPKILINLFTNQKCLCARSKRLSFFYVSILVYSVFNPVQQHFISCHNQIGFIGACKMVSFCGRDLKNISIKFGALFIFYSSKN